MPPVQRAAPPPTLRLLGQRASTALFAGFALAAALALATEALLGVLVETDAVAYPLLVVVALIGTLVLGLRRVAGVRHA